MPTSRRTSHFVSKTAAINYYSRMHIDPQETERKIREGEISIGCPLLVPSGAKVSVDKDEGRYILVYDN